MHIQVKFFASLREKLGVSQMSLDLPHEVKTIGDLRLELAKYSPGWDEIFAPQQNMRAAQHQVMVESTTLLEDNAEIAFFPPVTGG